MEKEVTTQMCKNKSLACGRQFLEFYGWGPSGQKVSKHFVTSHGIPFVIFSLQKRRKISNVN
jgi:hypothetical protein